MSLTAVSPILDNEGNVACMTYHIDSQYEQCVSSSVILTALNKLQSG